MNASLSMWPSSWLPWTVILVAAILGGCNQRKKNEAAGTAVEPAQFVARPAPTITSFALEVDLEAQPLDGLDIDSYRDWETQPPRFATGLTLVDSQGTAIYKLSDSSQDRPKATVDPASHTIRLHLSYRAIDGNSPVGNSTDKLTQARYAKERYANIINIVNLRDPQIIKITAVINDQNCNIFDSSYKSLGYHSTGIPLEWGHLSDII